MRVLVVGDPHARTSALGDFGRLTEALCVLLAQEEVDIVVVTGDLLHEHAYVHTAALNAAIELLRRLAVFPRRRLYALMGNHDLASNQVFLEPRHAFNALKGDSRLRIVDQVVLEDGFAFVPYVPPGRFLEALATAGEGWREARAIFAHQEFRGARDGMHLSQNGDLWRSDLPLVISGHYHGHQWLRRNICYVGSPMAHEFGSEGGHTVSLFTFQPDGGVDERRISLGLPERLTVEIPLNEAETYTPLDSGDLVRLIVTGAPHELMALRKSPVYKRLASKVHRVVLKSTAWTPPSSHGRSFGSYLDRLHAYAAAEADPLVLKALEAALGDDDEASQGQVRRLQEADACALL